MTKNSIGFRLKLIAAFFIIAALSSLALVFIANTLLHQELHLELRARLADMSVLGAGTIDRDALARLAALLPAAVTNESVAAAAEASADYRLLSDQLNRIRSTAPHLVRFVYLLAPGEDATNPRFLVDADLLADRPRLAAGDTNITLSEFAEALDATPFPVMQQAFSDRTNLVDTQFSYDETFRVNSLSGYAPVHGRDGTMLALLGIDMSDGDIQVALSRVTRIALAVAGGAVFFALLVSLLLGTVFTRGLVELDQAVHRIADQEFAVRVKVKGGDEVGRLGKSFNRMAETIQDFSLRQKALLKAYERFVPHDFLRHLDKTSILAVRLGDHAQHEMTVLFADIRNFTGLSEGMSPQENFSFINAFLKRVGPEIRKHNGFIDKFIGDALMALFPGSPRDALDAAIAMQLRIGEYNRERSASGFPTLRVGIGIHSGNLMLGTVGEEARMDGTVISDAVNVGSRLEEMTKLFGATILASSQVLERCGDRGTLHYRFLDRLLVRGRKDPISIFEVFDADPPAIRDKKLYTRMDFAIALCHFYARQFREAAALFATVLETHPEDPAARLYLDQSLAFSKEGAPPEWTGMHASSGKRTIF